MLGHKGPWSDIWLVQHKRFGNEICPCGPTCQWGDIWHSPTFWWSDISLVRQWHINFCAFLLFFGEKKPAAPTHQLWPKREPWLFRQWLIDAVQQNHLNSFFELGVFFAPVSTLTEIWLRILGHKRLVSLVQHFDSPIKKVCQGDMVGHMSLSWTFRCGLITF